MKETLVLSVGIMELDNEFLLLYFFYDKNQEVCLCFSQKQHKDDKLFSYLLVLEELLFEEF